MQTTDDNSARSAQSGQSKGTTLPHLAEVFEGLRRGMHICAEDGELYWALRNHIDEFTDLFSQLGFDLVVHRRDFFHFRTRHTPGERATRMALFVLILVEWLADQGQQVEETLLSGTFSLEELPHWSQKRYAAIMSEAGVTEDDGLALVVRNLEQFGFAVRLDGSNFRLRPPICRFLDLCLDVLKESDGISAETPVDKADVRGKDEM